MSTAQAVSPVIGVTNVTGAGRETFRFPKLGKFISNSTKICEISDYSGILYTQWDG